MVALQAALSLMLIIGAGLFLRTIGNLRFTPLGYQADGLLYVKVEPRTGGIPERWARITSSRLLHGWRAPRVWSAHPPRTTRHSNSAPRSSGIRLCQSALRNTFRWILVHRW